MNDRIDAAARWLSKHKLLGSCLVTFTVSMPINIGTIHLIALVCGITPCDAIPFGAPIHGIVSGWCFNRVYSYGFNRNARKSVKDGAVYTAPSLTGYFGSGSITGEPNVVPKFA